MGRIAAERLRKLRNEVDVKALIATHLELPGKTSEGYFRFLCPLCREFHTATNEKTNLARCFRCGRNFNPIDLVMVVRQCDFLPAVRYLEGLLKPSL